MLNSLYHLPVIFFLHFSWLYWTDREDNTITKGKTDGSTSTILHNTDINNPNGITLDLSSQRLFWANSGNQRIETSFTDGSNRMILIASTQAWGLSIFGGILYWAQWNPQRVKVASVNSTNTNITASLTSSLLPTGTAVISKHKQPLTGRHIPQHCLHQMIPLYFMQYSPDNHLTQMSMATVVNTPVHATLDTVEMASFVPVSQSVL